MLPSSTRPSTRHNSETTDSILYIVHIAREAQHGVSAAVSACDKKMFSLADVGGVVWTSSFGSVISQTTFYRKLLRTCRLRKVIPLYICISR